MMEPRPAVDPFGAANRLLSCTQIVTGAHPLPFGFKPNAQVTPLRGRRMAKRGRPTGATSWQRNPNPVAAHHAKVLMEVWLAGAPVLEIRVMLSSLAGNPEAQALIEECWNKLGNNRRYTVPPKIKRNLCRLAVAHVVELRRDAIQRRRARAAETALRAEGWADTQVAEILNRRAPGRIDFEAPGAAGVCRRLVCRSECAQGFD
jgi:hypothetical protein